MSNGFTKHVGSKAKDIAKQIGRQALDENKEFVDSAKRQLGVEPTSGEPSGRSLVDEIITGGGVSTEISPQEHSNIHSQERRRLQELEEELHRAHEAETSKLSSWQKSQEEILNPPESQEPNPLIEPTPHRKVGMLGGQQRSKGGLEIMKSKK